MEIQKLLEKNGPGRFALAGEDGNAFSIMARVRRGLRMAGWPPGDVDIVLREMRSSSYDHLLLTAMEVQE